MTDLIDHVDRAEPDEEPERPRGPLLWFFVVLVVAVVGFFLLTPVQVEPLFGGTQFAAHLLLLGGLGLVSAVVFGPTWKTLAVLLVVAVAVERLQGIQGTGHDPRLGDALLNVVGVLAGVGFVRLFGRKTPAWFANSILAISVIGVLAAGALVYVSLPEVQIRNTCENLPSADPLFDVDGPALASGSTTRATGLETAQDEVGDTFCTAAIQESLTIMMRVRSATLDQGGPTRILTSSTSSSVFDMNFHLGQDFDEASLRFRFSTAGSVEWIRAEDVFVTEGATVDLAVVFDAGELSLYCDGELCGGADLPANSLDSWDPTYPILLRNELTRDRPFDGEVEAFAFYDRALTVEQIEQAARGPIS